MVVVVAGCGAMAAVERRWRRNAVAVCCCRSSTRPSPAAVPREGKILPSLLAVTKGRGRREGEGRFGVRRGVLKQWRPMEKSNGIIR